MVCVIPLALVVWVCVLGATASQPSPHTHPHKQTDFRWNTRRVGNKKVATLTIRKDEERDRRSIPLVDTDDDTSGKKHHCHRHHHGEETRLEVWAAEGVDGNTRHREEEEEELIRTSRGLTPRFLAESNQEDRNLRHSRLNDVRPIVPDRQDTVSRLQDVFQSVGIPLNPEGLKNTTRISQHRRHGQRNSNGRQRRRKNRNRNTDSNKKRRRKTSKSCRRLRGKAKRRCRAALRRCKRLRGREKRKCRESAVETVPQNNDKSLFNFIKGKSLMLGKDACHYRYLKECSKKVGMLSDPSTSSATLIKCHLRDEFLKCMDEQRQKTCDPAYRIRGNMTAMRKKIRDVVWTPNSCLMSEAVEG